MQNLLVSGCSQYNVSVRSLVELVLWSMQVFNTGGENSEHDMLQKWLALAPQKHYDNLMAWSQSIGNSGWQSHQTATPR